MTCLATGFYPKEIDMFIRKKGRPVRKALSSDVYPNGDGTHQARLHVETPKSEANDYDCYLFHSTLKAPIVSKWETGNYLFFNHTLIPSDYKVTWYLADVSIQSATDL